MEPFFMRVLQGGLGSGSTTTAFSFSALVLTLFVAEAALILEAPPEVVLVEEWCRGSSSWLVWVLVGPRGGVGAFGVGARRVGEVAASTPRLESFWRVCSLAEDWILSVVAKSVIFPIDVCCWCKERRGGRKGRVLERGSEGEVRADMRWKGRLDGKAKDACGMISLNLRMTGWFGCDGWRQSRWKLGGEGTTKQ